MASFSTQVFLSDMALILTNTSLQYGQDLQKVQNTFITGAFNCMQYNVSLIALKFSVLSLSLCLLC